MVIRQFAAVALLSTGGLLIALVVATTLREREEDRVWVSTHLASTPATLVRAETIVSPDGR
jgi:hypothetical protein